MIRRLLGNALLLAMLFAIVFCLTGHAQIANGTIRGTVTDSTGAVLQNATVVLVNVGTAEQTTQPTNKEGYYTFPALSPADYTVKVIVPGFDAWEVKLTLRVAQEAVIDAKLKPGTVKEIVTVNDATPLIDAADGTVSDVKEATRIETIPVQDSNFLSILNFTPGVVANGYGGAGGGYTRVNGIPGGSITFQVDGQSANDRFTNDLQAVPQALQTIQELKVTTSNGGAEYSTPGVVEVVTKSGTNQFHGQVHELYQTGGLEAWQFNSYYPGAKHPHNIHNEFGGQLGGPVLIPKLYNGKNKTFFYFDVEKKIVHSNKADQELVFQKNWETGDLSDLKDMYGNPITVYDPMSGVYDPTTGYVTRTPFHNNQVPVSAIAAKIMSYMPTPNVNVNSSGQIDPAQMYYGFDWINPAAHKTDDMMRYTVKVDQLFGKNLLSARYSNISESILEPDEGGNQGAILTPNVESRIGHNGVLSFTTPIGANSINEARVGIQMFNNYDGPEPGLYPSESQLGLPQYVGAIGLPAFYYWDPNNFWNYSTIQEQNPKWSPNQNISLGDNYSWTRGKNEMKFGFQVVNTRVTTAEFQSPGGDYFFDGNFTALETADSSTIPPPNIPTGLTPAGYTLGTGSSLADMLLGDVDVTQYNQLPIFHTRQTDYDGYAQDNFKLSPRLTLNLGVRWEYWSPYTDAGGLSATLDYKHTAACVIPASLGNTSGAACVTPGTAGYPAWFGQSSPTVIIPNSGAAQKQPINANGLLADEAAGLPVETAAQAGISNSLWNMPKNNWAPRLGFAYQLDDKTVIRGGYGMYYWTMPLVSYHQNTRDNVPWATIVFPATDPDFSAGQGYGPADGNYSAEIGFPFAPINPSYTTAGWGSQCNCLTLPSNYVNPRQLGIDFVTPAMTTTSNVSGWDVMAWDPNYKAQRAQEWNLTVERALPGNFAASVSYVGNHGGNLTDYDPVNASLPRELMPSPAPGGYSGLPYPIYQPGTEGSMDKFQFIGYSNHNEGRAEIKHTFRGSFILQSYFTFARTLGTSEGTLDSFGGLELQPATLTNNAPKMQRLKAIYAPDSYMPEKTFVINGHYELPFGKGKPFLAQSSTAVNEVVSGWNATLFYMWHSGLFFSPLYSANPGLGGRNAPVGNTLIPAPGALHPGGVLPRGSRTAAHWFDASVWDPAGLGGCGATGGATYAGQTYECRDNPLDTDLLNGIPRNNITGPGFSNADGTLYKMTPIGNHVKLDLEMQVFNVFNHTNLGSPNQGGVINGAVGGPNPTSARLLQFQGKLVF